MRSKKADEFLEREKHTEKGCPVVYLCEAQIAVEMAERELMAKVEKAWDAMSEATRFDIPTDVLIKAHDIFRKELMKDENSVS